MYTKKKYSLIDMIRWTRVEIAIFFAVALVPTVLFEAAEWQWLRLPWTPIALVGTDILRWLRQREGDVNLLR